MTIPYLKPTTRDQARRNAIYFAEAALEGNGMGSADLDLHHAQAWSAIAMTFPEEPTYVVDDLSGVQERVVQAYTDPLHNAEGFDPREMADRNGFGDPDATAVLELPRRDPSVGVVGASGLPPGVHATVSVDAVAWDVLRLLAIRYVLGSIQRGVTVDLTDEDTGPRVWSLEFTRMPDSPIVHVSVSREGDTVTG